MYELYSLVAMPPPPPPPLSLSLSLSLSRLCGHTKRAIEVLLDEHVPQLRELAVLAVLHLDEAPLGLSAKQLLSPDCYLTITAYHCKWNELLEGRRGRRERERGRGKQMKWTNVTVQCHLWGPKPLWCG